LKINKIIVSQPPPAESERSPYSELADKYQLHVDFKPFIRIEGVTAREFRVYKVDILEHGAVFLTSKTAVDHFFRICDEMRITVPDTMKYFCISESIANYLQKYITYRKRRIFFGAKMDELFSFMQKHQEEKILLPLSDPHKPEIPKLLDKKNFKYTKAILYRTVSCKLSDINITDYDLLAFYSPSEIKSLFHNFPGYQQGETLVACFGPTTVKAAKKAHLRIDIQAPRSQIPSLTMAIEYYLKDLARKAAEGETLDNK
jgi:uroporphyrinogen-III synthase